MEKLNFYIEILNFHMNNYVFLIVLHFLKVFDLISIYRTTIGEHHGLDVRAPAVLMRLLCWEVLGLVSDSWRFERPACEPQRFSGGEL